MINIPTCCRESVIGSLTHIWWCVTQQSVMLLFILQHYQLCFVCLRVCARSWCQLCSSVVLDLSFWDRICYWSWSHQFGETSQPANPRNSHISTSLVLNLEKHVALPCCTRFCTQLQRVVGQLFLLAQQALSQFSHLFFKFLYQQELLRDAWKTWNNYTDKLFFKLRIVFFCFAFLLGFQWKY